jgi:hypothetical protein
LQLINADTVTSRLFRKSFNCRYNPRMDYAFCLLTLKSSEKWRSPLFGATCNFNDQILPYGILFSHSLTQMSFIYCPFKRFWVFAISPSRLRIDHVRCAESLASYKNRWRKTRLLLSFQIRSFDEIAFNICFST